MKRERGTITVMTIGFLMLLGLLTVVVVDSSAAFLERQRLNNLADGAALAAADGLDEPGFYTDRRVVLDPAEARRLVGDYLAGEQLRVVDVRSDGDTVQRAPGARARPGSHAARLDVEHDDRRRRDLTTAPRLAGLGSTGDPVGLLEELGELVRLHLWEPYEDELG